MLKRIKVEQLTLGMHLKQFCGSWLEHPFWRTGFVITRQQDLDAVRASTIQEVWIDCSKGLDVAGGEPPSATAQTDAQVHAELQADASARRDSAPTPLADEYRSAARIVKHS